MITILKGDEAMHSMACAVGHVCWHYKWMVWWLLELLISQETGLVCDEKGLGYTSFVSSLKETHLAQRLISSIRAM